MQFLCTSTLIVGATGTVANCFEVVLLSNTISKRGYLDLDTFNFIFEYSCNYVYWRTNEMKVIHFLFFNI